MDFIDMMHAGLTKNDPFSCPVLALLRGLLLEGLARELNVGLVCGRSRSRFELLRAR
jgi:hypothetical protein